MRDVAQQSMYLIYYVWALVPEPEREKMLKMQTAISQHRKLKGYPHTHHPNQTQRTKENGLSNHGEVTKLIDWPTKAVHTTPTDLSQHWLAKLTALICWTPLSKSPHCLLLVWEYPLVPWKEHADPIHREILSKSQNKQINLMAVHSHAHMHSRTHSMCRYIAKARNRCPLALHSWKHHPSLLPLMESL